VSTCASDADCASDIGLPYCDLARNTCVQCLVDNECPQIKPRCFTERGTCVLCIDDGDCAAPTPHCDTGATHACYACNVDLDCGASGAKCLQHECVLIPR
jgi:hypothetical protein